MIDARTRNTSVDNGNDRLVNVVSFLGEDWEASHRLPHHQALGKYCRLLCVERPLSVDTVVRNPRVVWRWIWGKGRMRRLTDTHWICRPAAAVPYSISLRFPLLKGLNRLAMRLSLTPLIRRLDMNDIVVLVEHPAQDYLIGLLSERVLCYEVYDAYAETLGLSSRARERFVLAEENLLRRADVVFTTATSLADDKRKHNANTYFVPNAADTKMFERSLSSDTDTPPDLQQITRPRVGLIGHVTDSHTDIELLNYLAEGHPEWSILVIGRIEASAHLRRSVAFREWQRRPNVHCLGFKDYGSLPAYLKGLDVCILPYKTDGYARMIFPNKLFQYLAGGKPVVSTDLPEMKPYGDVIAIAKDHAEFERLVEEALRDNSPEKVAQRIRVAGENSVERRAKEKIDILESCLQGKRRKASHG